MINKSKGANKHKIYQRYYYELKNMKKQNHIRLYIYFRRCNQYIVFIPKTLNFKL